MPEWSETTAQVLKSHGVSAKSGLSASQVARLTAEHGKNELAQEEATPLWKLVLAQFDDLLVKILLGAAVLSFVLACFEEAEGVEAFVEPFVILLILVINAVVGVWQEHNAESALEALKQMQSATAKCIRGGELVPDLPAEELVPGDIVEIGVGDKVPADVASGGATALPRSLTRPPFHTGAGGRAHPPPEDDDGAHRRGRLDRRVGDGDEADGARREERAHPGKPSSAADAQCPPSHPATHATHANHTTNTNHATRANHTIRATIPITPLMRIQAKLNTTLAPGSVP